jgi:hypothetical protein
MVRMTKFQTSSLRVGSLEGSILYRSILVGFAILLAIFFFGLYGLISLALLPMFLLRIQYDYVDEFIIKKVRGITVPTLVPLITKKDASYEIFGTNYGLSERQDGSILSTWTSIVGAFSEDLTILRHPYKIPLQRFQMGVKEYDALFSQLDCYADAYFIKINKTKTEEFENTLRNHGVAFTRLSDEEVEVLNEFI